MILCPVFTNFHFHEKKKFPCRNEEWRERLKEKWHRPEMSCKTKHHMITKLLWIKLHWFDSQRVWVGVYAVVLSLFYSKMQMQNVANNTNLLLCGVFFLFFIFLWRFHSFENSVYASMSETWNVNTELVVFELEWENSSLHLNPVCVEAMKSDPRFNPHWLQLFWLCEEFSV